jgi:DNA polymerase I
MKSEWNRIHDTVYLLFLADPYAPTFSLKPSADRYLDMPPTEQDTLRDWILANVPEATAKDWGAYIIRSPGLLCGEYAIGDVVRTRKLFGLLHSRIVEQGMQAAYDRERELMPLLVEGTQRGIRIDRWKLEHHERVYTQALERADDSIVSNLGCSHADLEHDNTFADALERAGAVTEWVITPSGKRSMSKDNLKFTSSEVGNLLRYKGALQTCLNTFMRPWLQKSAADGRLHPNWNQVKQQRGSSYDNKGAKTGRLSSDNPNFQNVPTEFTDQFGNPLPFPDGLVPLPMLREYCLPDEGYLWLKRDYSSQELRITAHFEDGSLAEAYRGNPNLDPHLMAIELIERLIGVVYARKSIKITGFSIIYGSGITGLSQQLHQPYDEASRIRSAYLAAMPGINDLMRDVKRRGERGDSIRTLGGRIYYAENGTVNGQVRSFAYRLLNYLIQGSAADQTKESLNEWRRTKDWQAEFLATVHDENNIQAPEDDWVRHMNDLKVAMEKDNLDVPIRSEGFVGKDWHNIVEESKYGQQSTVKS